MKKILIILIVTFIFATQSYGYDKSYVKILTEAQANEWTKNNNHVLLSHSIICDSPEKLIRLWNFIVINNYNYNKNIVNRFNCDITYRWYLVNTTKKLYDEKISQIDYYITIIETNFVLQTGKTTKNTTYTLHKNLYVLSQQIMSDEEIKRNMIH